MAGSTPKTKNETAAQSSSAGQEEVIGVGRYMTDAAKISAEMAFVVRDDWQGRGIGTFLFHRLVEIARSHGIHKFHAEVLTENSGMLKIFHRSSLNVETTSEEGVVSVSMEVPDKPVDEG
jgi:GNAT superfamily N-acetyltransferase